MPLSSKTRVAVLRGGESPEYDTSLQTGAYVIRHLSDKFEVLDVLIDKNGIWHLAGFPKKPEAILHQSDVVFNALHGGAGENGHIQHLLKLHGVPYVGSSVMSSVLGMNKHLAKNIFLQNDIHTPVHMLVRKDEMTPGKVQEIFSSLPHPAIVKPTSLGSSYGLRVVADLRALADALEQAFVFGDAVIVEEYIAGREVTCGIIEKYRDHDGLYVLPAFEIKRGVEGTMFDHLSLTQGEKSQVEKVAQLAHKALGHSLYSRSDMVVHPKRGVFLLETTSQPALSEQSPFIHSLDLVGAPPSHFLEHILQQII